MPSSFTRNSACLLVIGLPATSRLTPTCPAGWVSFGPLVNKFIVELDQAVLASRWQTRGLCTLVRVSRLRQTLAGGKLSRDVHYFVSNAVVGSLIEANEFFNAVRPHGRIEGMHQQRNVNLEQIMISRA